MKKTLPAQAKVKALRLDARTSAKQQLISAIPGICLLLLLIARIITL